MVVPEVVPFSWLTLMSPLTMRLRRVSIFVPRLVRSLVKAAVPLLSGSVTVLVVAVVSPDRSKASFFVPSAVFLMRIVPSGNARSVVPVPPNDTGHAALNVAATSAVNPFAHADRMVVLAVTVVPGTLVKAPEPSLGI